MSFLTAANSARVERQKHAPIFVIIGNPPYNAHQVNENDNSKNRKYKLMDSRVASTYAKDSAATNKNALSDPYVKAFKWASRRIEENGEGIVAFVSNNSFVNDFTFDGMRKHLVADFNRIYVLDLKGNIRKDSMRDGIPLGEQHTVFGLSAMVGIAITFLIKKKVDTEHKVFYKTVDFRSTRVEKFALLEKAQAASNLDWQELTPDPRHTWLTEGLQDDFETFLPMGSKEAKAGNGQAIFNLYSGGVKTNRDAWAYNFNANEIQNNIGRMLEVYNEHVLRWSRFHPRMSINDFVLPDDEKISWSEGLKNGIERQIYLEFDEKNIRLALYRPFVNHYLYFSQVVTERRYQFPDIFPRQGIENSVIWLKVGSEWPMFALMTNKIPDVLPQGGSQCFPFYVYNEDGSNRRENITDWALQQFRAQYTPHPPPPSPQSGEGGLPLLHVMEKGPGDEVKRSSPPHLWSKLKPLARQTRHDPTPAEDRLWQSLRNRQLENAKFRRQHAIDRFILDLYCPEHNLVIEIDGPIHQYTVEEDAIRQEYLESQGLRVLRFTNEEVMQHTAAVLEKIRHALTPHPKAMPPLLHAMEKGPGDEVSISGPGDEVSTSGPGDEASISGPGDEVSTSGPGDEVSTSGPGDEVITKWDIFYYVYALLHQPAYRQKYAANLKRDLPHIPFVEGLETFWRYVAAGKRLAELHVHYEDQPEYPLEMVENPAASLDWRVEKMRLSKDKTEIQYNGFLTLRGIPAQAFEYRLGNRSALEWVIDQYRVTVDPRSKIVNDPNNPDDPQYILRLVKKVITVSLETVKIVKQLA